MSFRWKLLGAFALIAFLAAGGTYFLTTREVSSRFDAFREENRQLAAQEFAAALAQIWESSGNWDVLRSIFASVAVIVRGREVIYERNAWGQFMVVDSDYMVVGCAAQELIGECIADDPQFRAIVERYGMPIMADGVRVGTVVPLDIAALNPLEEDFLRSIQRAVLVGGAAALVAAALLAVLLAAQLSRPLKRLILATARIAKGDLAHRVTIRTQDEIGRLGRAFNEMAVALESSEKSRQNLLADVAHELRTPLAVVRGNLEGMLDGVFPLTPEGLALVYDQILHLADLVEDLRTLTLAEAGHLQLVREPTDIGDLVRAVVEGVRPTAAEERVTLVVEAQPGFRADVDPRRIRQVLGNLLDNALRYSPPGGTVTVSVRPEGVEILVTVRDQGPGISPQDLPHVFERLYRGDASRSGEGTGLGLAIARELVQAHGGRIWVENQGGAVFTFTLPAVDSPSSAI
ncbi:HAMP domain-containing protein [Candidatus Bipolaricaulota bacterium]|nr:HAMP domain-containing protein [Candidatus Bipolaricaulota bacterium]